ncbi:MAG: MATE family efflux transporter [Oscillospiraceae bacterium]
MRQPAAGTAVFEEKSVWKVLMKIAPPVMLAQLIQALYNIVDSFFVGKYSGDGLTALSIIFPVQLVITAIAVGTGVGVNTQMSRQYARGEKVEETAGTGTALALISWAAFALTSTLLMRPYVMTSATAPEAIEYAVQYGTIVCVGSIGVFLEGIWTKVHQAAGNMRRPMLAQVAGAMTNIVLDPILIFGAGPIPSLGVAGAAYATVAGQFVAAAITFGHGFYRPPGKGQMLPCVKAIYRLGYPSILMQALYTVYIMALNIILAASLTRPSQCWTLLQASVVLFHSPGRAANLYCPAAELYIRQARLWTLPEDYERRYDLRRNLHDGGDALF